MPKNVPAVNIAVVDNIYEKGSSINAAAKAINKSRKQLGREINGQTKIGIIRLDTMAELKHADLIDEETVEAWWPSAKEMLHLKKEEPRMVVIIRSLRNCLTSFYRKSR